MPAPPPMARYWHARKVPEAKASPLAEEAPEQDSPPPQEGIEDGMVVVQQGHPVSIHVVGGDDGAEGVHIDPAGEIGQDIGQPGKEEQGEGRGSKRGASFP